MKKYLFLIAIVIGLFSINACKEKDDCPCVGIDCPLSTGELCPNNMINVNDNCTCPEGFIEFNSNCKDPNTSNAYIGDLSCHCMGEASFSFGAGGLGYSIETAQGYFGTFSYIGNNIDDFIFLPDYEAFKCGNEIIYPEFRGAVIGDTLYFDIYWREPGPNWETPVDSCMGIKIAQI